jgi:Predicted small integral membrane protein
MEHRSWTDVFNAFARYSAAAVGSPWVFLLAVLVVIAWILAGPTFQYSNAWQLVINTGTTIVTFLTVFLIQNTQNRDAKAIHLKLDELIHKIKGPRNTLIALETCTDEELEQLQQQFEKLKRSQPAARTKLNDGSIALLNGKSHDEQTHYAACRIRCTNHMTPATAPMNRPMMPAKSPATNAQSQNVEARPVAATWRSSNATFRTLL